jgi:NAD(P)-dependent dehydrogenase (short-subunit alcohol dehydrogenase family)
MELGLKDKVALVTGASRGIGLALASLLVDEGMRVIAISRSEMPRSRRRPSPPRYARG